MMSDDDRDIDIESDVSYNLRTACPLTNSVYFDYISYKFSGRK